MNKSILFTQCLKSDNVFLSRIKKIIKAGFATGISKSNLTLKFADNKFKMCL